VVKFLEHPPIHWVQAALFPGVKWPATEVKDFRLSNAEVKNTWSYTSAPNVCLYGLELDTFTFTFTITVKGCYYAHHLL